MKTILITGGLGYIGSAFCELFSDKYKIHILDTGFFGNLTSQGIKVVNKDIRNIDKNDLKDIEIVIHMSELSNDPLGEFNPSITNSINHEGTKNLLNLCNSSQVKKFIYMSSASVYGFNEEVVTENSKTNPLTEYAKAKINNENYIIDNHFNFESIIFRNSTVFGFSKNLRLDLVVNDLTFGALQTGKISLISDGSPKRPFIHVKDLSNLLDIVINDERVFDKEIFNTGSNSLNFSIREIAMLVSKLTNINKIDFGKKDSDQRSYYLNFDKLSETFPQFKVQYEMIDGVEDLIHQLRKYNVNGNEKRLKKLRYLIDGDKLNKDLYWYQE